MSEIVGKKPCKRCGVFCWENENECPHCGETRTSAGPDGSVPPTAPAAATEKKDKWITSNGAVVWVWGLGISISPISDPKDERTVILSRQDAIEIIERLREVHNLDEAPRPMEQQRESWLNEFHRINVSRQHEAFAPAHSLLGLIACVSEETGELASAALGVTNEKKRKAGMTNADMLDAVADAMTYLSLVADRCGCSDLQGLLGETFNMVSDRAGSKFKVNLGSGVHAGETRADSRQPETLFSPAPATATEEKERVIQEIKDLFALYGSGGYTPEEWEKNIIDEGLRTLLSPQPSATDEQIARRVAKDIIQECQSRGYIGWERLENLAASIVLSAIQEAKRQE